MKKCCERVSVASERTFQREPRRWKAAAFPNVNFAPGASFERTDVHAALKRKRYSIILQIEWYRGYIRLMISWGVFLIYMEDF